MIWPCTILICVLQLPFSEKAALHIGQANGFSPVWVLICLFISALHLISLGQNGQATLFGPICIGTGLFCTICKNQKGKWIFMKKCSLKKINRKWFTKKQWDTMSSKQWFIYWTLHLRNTFFTNEHVFGHAHRHCVSLNIAYMLPLICSALYCYCVRVFPSFVFSILIRLRLRLFWIN